MITAPENHEARLTTEIRATSDDPRPSIPHEEVMSRMHEQLARWQEGKATQL